MEILELLVGLAQLADGCGCLFELIALGVNGTTAYNGVATYQKRKKIDRRNAVEDGPPVKKPSWWPFIILLILAVGLTLLLAVKYSR